MQVKFRKLSERAVVPAYATKGSAGMDMVATSKEIDDYGNVVYGTDIAVEIPEGYCGLVFPRSSNSKKDLILSNSVGLIDSDYRGEIKFKFKLLSNIDIYNDYSTYEIGDRIGQLVIVPYPHIDFVESDTLSETERGNGGYGSTGR